MEGDKLIVSVADEGIGIDPKKQQTLFQRFETLVKYNILQPSSGIGLSLVKELIELHCGSIEVKSQPEVGSEFIVTLPMGQEIYETHENTEFILNDGASTETDNEIDEVSQDMPMDTDKVDPISILIVEDNMELRSFLHTILTKSLRQLTVKKV